MRWALALWVGGLGVSLFAAAEQPVVIQPAASTYEVEPGGALRVRLQLAIEEPYHIYGTETVIGPRGQGPAATSVRVVGNPSVSLAGGITTSPAQRAFDPNFDLELSTLEGRAWIEVPLRVKPDAAPGACRVELVVGFQACTPETCLPPGELRVPLVISVRSAGDGPRPTPRSAEAATEFRGKLAAQVEPGTRVQVPVIPAAADLVSRLPVAPVQGDRVWAGSRPASIKGSEFSWVVVASPSGEKVLWFDRDRSGRFEETERFPLDGATKAVAFDLPWENGIYRTFPLRFEVSTAKVTRGAAAETTAAEPVAPTTVTAVVYNFNLVYQGTVDVDGRPLALAFYPLPAVTEIDPARIRTSMDANFNGRVENELGEMDSGRGKAPVYRVGSRILAVKSVDLKTGDLVVEQRPDAEYTRFDAQPGQLMPDFAFVDFGGAARKLSDYRGKFVLLDFWGTWCGPCIEEMKHLDPLYETYASRGFEVIGMNMEKTAGNLSAADYAAVTDKARAYIAKAGHRWVQATQESIERVALDVLHVNSYPTCILIDPQGRVISRYARADTLVRLLAEHLPAGKQPVEK